MNSHHAYPRFTAKKFAIGSFFAVACAATTHAAAQYPDRPIRYIVPQAAGSASDTSARIIAHELTRILGQQVVVDNRPGAAGNIAVEILTRSAGDGHTLLYSSNAIAVSPGLYSKLAYDPLKDITPVTEIGAGCLIFFVHPALPIKSVPEFIAYAKARPGQMNFASSGTGTSTHLAPVMFSQRVGIQTQHIPYKGTAPSLVDMIGGRVQFMMGAVLTAVPHIRDGRLRALGVTGKKRIASLPDLRTLDEADVPGFVVTTWQGLFAPANVPTPVLARVNAEFVKAIKSPDLRPKIEQQDMEPTAPGHVEFNQMYRAELARWTKVAKDAGLKAD